jgi:hypothetical protein
MKNRSSINTFSIHHVAMMSLLMVFSYVNAEDTKKNEVGIPSDPQGEWYEVGYFMAREAAPGFRMFTIANPDASVRLTRVIETLGLDVSTVKTTDLALIQQGWDDFLAGRKQAMTYPPDQTGSLVPVPLRGFHRFTNSATGELAENAAEWKKAVVLVRSRITPPAARKRYTFRPTHAHTRRRHRKRMLLGIKAAAAAACSFA